MISSSTAPRSAGDAAVSPSGRTTNVGHQPLVARPDLPIDDCRLLNRRMRRQNGLDLAKLDPVPANRHLPIDAAEEFDVSRPAASGRGRRCGTSGLPGTKGLEMNFRAVNSSSFK